MCISSNLDRHLRMFSTETTFLAPFARPYLSCRQYEWQYLLIVRNKCNTLKTTHECYFSYIGMSCDITANIYGLI